MGYKLTALDARVVVSDELGGIRKEVAVIYFKALFQYLSGEN
jgi:hypothetical protein